MNRMLGVLIPQRQELLSFEEVKSLLQPTSQSYRGLKVVEVRLIVGSEGRYQDFNHQFTPKHDNMKSRWVRVDEARLKDIILPPIKLFELGGVYFVRDGNHRVSVAMAQGVERIDAEVVSLNSEIHLKPGMTREELLQAVIDWERQQFMAKTKFDKILPGVDLRLTSTGQYDEILGHIYVHKYFVNQDYEEELPFYYALISWYETVYLPIIAIVLEEQLPQRFPGRTEADLYVWIVKHWHYLKEAYGDSISPRDAANSYSEHFGQDKQLGIFAAFKSLFQRGWEFIKSRFRS
jgi:hypothetical protein